MKERMGTAQALKNATRGVTPARPASATEERATPRGKAAAEPAPAGSVTPFAPPGPPPAKPAAPSAATPQPAPAVPAAPAPPAAPPAPPVAPPVAVAPLVRPARRQRRHRGVIASFLVLVLLPLALVAGYMWGFARDQYASSTGFTLRQEDDPTAAALTGGLAAMLGAGSGHGANARVLHDYVQSPALVARLEERAGLRAIYAPGWSQDPLFAVAPDATIEDLTSFWLRMTRIDFDEASGLMAITVRAHDPGTAQSLATLVVEEAQAMINRLNRAARDDAMRHADADLAEAVARMRTARAALAEFRATTQIVDPAADLQSRMGILTGLQEQLAAAYVDLDLLNSVSSMADDPRRRQLDRRIAVIRDRIATERRNFTDQDVTVPDTDYPTLFARYEGLLVDQEVADITFRTAQGAHDLARARAARQTLYLATHIEPTLAQKSQYPARAGITALAGLFLLLGWSVLVLVWYSLRDRG